MVTLAGEEVRTTCTVSRSAQAFEIAATFTAYAAELFDQRRRRRLP